MSEPLKVPGAWPDQFLAFADAEGIRISWMDRVQHCIGVVNLLGHCLIAGSNPN